MKTQVRRCLLWFPILSASAWQSNPLPRTRPRNNLQDTLLPQENPQLDLGQMSTSDVSYREVFDRLQELFPPKALDERTASSRSDGYWPYLQSGRDPPKQYTYGEFDFFFFAQLLDKVSQRRDDEFRVFTDIGSGTGRLVIAAALLHPSLRCRGIEILSGIHEVAQQMSSGIDNTEFVCGSFEDPYLYFGDSDVIFCFSSCMGDDLIAKLSVAVGRQCRPGTVVITTDKPLDLEGTVPRIPNDDRVPHGKFKMELIDVVDGYCWLTGGSSTAYIHSVVQSLAMPPLEPPVLSLEDRCVEVVHAYESGKLIDYPAFARGVRNNMIFHNIPERFHPKIDS